MARMYKLQKVAQEQGTYGVEFTFKDENGSLISTGSISSLVWWLTDVKGTVINGRSAVDVSVTSNPYAVVMSGADLQIINKDLGSEDRVLTVKGVYDSDLGVDLPFTYAVSFSVINLLVIAADLYLTTAEQVFTGEFIYV